MNTIVLLFSSRNWQRRCYCSLLNTAYRPLQHTNGNPYVYTQYTANRTTTLDAGAFRFVRLLLHTHKHTEQIYSRYIHATPHRYTCRKLQLRNACVMATKAHNPPINDSIYILSYMYTMCVRVLVACAYVSIVSDIRPEQSAKAGSRVQQFAGRGSIRRGDYHENVAM